MPFVVVDTSISLPATLSPRGLMRRFWVVLALGALTYEVEHRQLELDELSRQAETRRRRRRRLERAHARIEAARSRRADLLELLPEETPDDWVAIRSAPLFDEYERKLREIGPKLDPALRDEDIPPLRRQLEAVCTAGAPSFDPGTVPELTNDRNDDAILFTALVGDADLLIFDDKHLVPNRHEHPWEHGGRVVTAITFDTLVNERLDPTSLGAIDGSWLAIAHGRPWRIRRPPERHIRTGGTTIRIRDPRSSNSTCPLRPFWLARAEAERTGERKLARKRAFEAARATFGATSRQGQHYSINSRKC